MLFERTEGVRLKKKKERPAGRAGPIVQGMSSTPDPKSFPILEELLKRSERLRKESERLNAEVKELEQLIALTEKAPHPEGDSARKGDSQK